MLAPELHPANDVLYFLQSSHPHSIGLCASALSSQKLASVVGMEWPFVRVTGHPFSFAPVIAIDYWR